MISFRKADILDRFKPLKVGDRVIVKPGSLRDDTLKEFYNDAGVILEIEPPTEHYSDGIAVIKWDKHHLIYTDNENVCRWELTDPLIHEPKNTKTADILDRFKNRPLQIGDRVIIKPGTIKNQSVRCLYNVGGTILDFNNSSDMAQIKWDREVAYKLTNNTCWWETKDLMREPRETNV